MVCNHVIQWFLGAFRHTPLGIPQTRGKLVFNVGEELLRTANRCQNSRLSRERTQAGWLLIGSIMTLGSGVVKGLLPRMMLLWRNAFPKTLKELESERARGDGFTWKISIEARAGALASMHSFLQVMSFRKKKWSRGSLKSFFFFRTHLNWLLKTLSEESLRPSKAPSCFWSKWRTRTFWSHMSMICELCWQCYDFVCLRR